jgi:hypothetical protein
VCVALKTPSVLVAVSDGVADKIIGHLLA